MPVSKAIIQIYSEVTVCHEHCDGMRNEPEKGNIPRSFYCPNEPAETSLLLVSKNPGSGSEHEYQLYAPLSAQERVRVHEQFVGDRFKGRNAHITSRYHANILSWVSIILGVEPTHDAVFEKAAMTALVKCSSLNLKTDIMPRTTKDHCSDRFLFREIVQIRPAYLLALGSETHAYLTRPDVAQRHGLPVGKLNHPSWTNMKGGVEKYKSEVLPQLRDDYMTACSVQRWRSRINATG